MRQMWDAVNHGWNQWVLGFDRDQQNKLLRALGIKDMSWQNLLTILISAMITLIAIITAVVLLKRPRQQDPVQRQYLHFCNKLAKLGVIREINEGPLDFAQRACEELPQQCERISAITQLYVEIRYQQLNKSAELKSLRLAVQQM